jgi:group I intron endonuclease
METYGYIYITTNKLNGKRYVGQHKSKDWDYNYYGSGKLVGYAIKKYGIENFICFPLAWAWSKEELNKLEIEYIAHYNPEYNISTGGNGGNLGEAVNRKISEAAKNMSDETRRKMSEIRVKKCLSKGENNPMYNHIYSDKTRKKIADSRKGKHHSEETKQKISKLHFGRHWFTNGIINRFCYECPDGFLNGKIHFKKKG